MITSQFSCHVWKMHNLQTTETPKKAKKSPFLSNPPSILPFRGSPKSRMLQWIPKILKFFILDTILSFKSNYIYIYMTLWLLSVDRMQLPQGHTEPLRGDSLLFSRNSWYSLDQYRKDERLRRPWSHPVVLNLASA